MKTGVGGVYDKPSQNSNYVTGVLYIYTCRHAFGGGGVCEMFPKFPTFVHHLFSVCSPQPIALAIPLQISIVLHKYHRESVKI